MNKVFKAMKSLFSIELFELIELKDGSKLKVEKIEVGMPILNENDEVVKDGDYELVDGRMIVVKEGLISEIKEKPAETTEEKPTDMVETETVVETTNSNDEMIKSLDIRLLKIEKLLSSIIGEDITLIDMNQFNIVKLDDEFENLKKDLNVIKEKVDKIANTTIEAITTKKFNKKNDELNRFAKYQVSNLNEKGETNRFDKYNK